RKSRRLFHLIPISKSLASVKNLKPKIRPEGSQEMPYDTQENTIAELQRDMGSGRLTVRAVTDGYLERIDRYDKQGPTVNAVMELNPDSRSMADELDKERGTEIGRRPLRGVPIIVKDNIETACNMATSAGSLALAHWQASEDAFIVRRLRESGAIILGKSNLSEWANFRSIRSTSGWSSRGGQTRNPYALDRSPGGSSSGSAVAVAASFCSVAIGTETDGSIITPSSVNSIVGLKPTVGLVSRSGIVPLAHSQDTAGPMGRTVEDVARLLGVISGADADDPTTLESEGKSYDDYTQFLDPNGMEGARIGVDRNMFGANPKSDELINTHLEKMKELGAEIVDPVALPTADAFVENEFKVLLHEFKAGINTYLSKLGPEASVHSLKELIEFNRRHRRQTMPYFGQELLLMAQAADGLDSRGYLEALETNRLLARTEGIDAVLQEHGLDAIVAPSDGPACPIDLVNGDHHLKYSSYLAAVAGYPHITVPAGQVFGLPVGLSFFSGAYREPILIKLAYAFEQATRLRLQPRFKAGAILPQTTLCPE
ncbi:MAG: amidase, partial [Proteobacteria bacterium]|nr:amidase [Pseudomonadota bacterium]